MTPPPYAEDVNYWRTGQSSPDTWLDHAKAEIAGAGGTVTGEAYVAEAASGRQAYMLAFMLDGERYKVQWPVLPTKSGNERTARIQAATMLYHDVKARCVSAKVLGARTAFLGYLMLPDDRTAAEVATPALASSLPPLLTAGKG
jgi:hypothetical protein